MSNFKRLDYRVVLLFIGLISVATILTIPVFKTTNLSPVQAESNDGSQFVQTGGCGVPGQMLLAQANGGECGPDVENECGPCKECIKGNCVHQCDDDQFCQTVTDPYCKDCEELECYDWSKKDCEMKDEAWWPWEDWVIYCEWTGEQDCKWNGRNQRTVEVTVENQESTGWGQPDSCKCRLPVGPGEPDGCPN